MPTNTIQFAVRIKHEWLIMKVALPVVSFFAQTALIMGFHPDDCYKAGMNVMAKLIMGSVVVERV